MDDIRTIRNISIIAHIDAGKTTTTERMLYYSGRTHRIGDIDDGSTVMDYLDEERKRGITIVSAAASFPWREHLVHLIDTPGHIDFTAEVERSLRVIDAAVVIFSGVEGVEAQSEKVWHQANLYALPRLAFINKLDRIGASFPRVLEEINAKFGGKAVPLQVPVGIENELGGVIDLLSMRMLTFGGEAGERVESVEIPAAEKENAQRQREHLIERLADHSDALAERFLEGSEITVEMIADEIRRLTIATTIVPVLAGSAKRNIGIQPLMDAVLRYLPNPAEAAESPAFSAADDEPVTIAPDPSAPFAGFVFKLIASTTADLYYLRTYRGTLKAGDSLYVPRTRETIRVKRILRLYAKQIEPIEQVGPGDIVGISGPREIMTGDTLCTRHQAVYFEQMKFPEPVLSMAVEPRSSKDKDHLDEALQLLAREDPTLAVSRDENTGQRILSGMGELHLEINTNRIEQEFHLQVRCGEPRVAYRETINRQVTAAFTFERMAGEAELYAKVTLTLRPKEQQDPPFLIENKVRTPNLDKKLLRAAVDALTDGIKTGGHSGYPLIYVSAELNELDVQPGKTTEGAVLGAVLQALDKAVNDVGTHILEPIMTLDILTPDSHLGDITNDVHTRRGLIHNVIDVVDLKRVICEVPLAEMFGFSKALPKLTGGRGSFSMEPRGYKAMASS